jgi:hypothetical protein
MKNMGNGEEGWWETLRLFKETTFRGNFVALNPAQSSICICHHRSVRPLMT